MKAQLPNIRNVRALAKAQLTGICPRCADEGWWIDDDTSDGGTGFHYCSCAAGAKAKEEDGEGG